MKSMTGFGSASISRHQIDIDLEIKSVNARYLDLRLYLPRELMFFESSIRSLLPKTLSRGTVEVRISYSDHRAPKLILDTNKLMKYRELASSAAKLLNLEDTVSIEYLLQEPGVIESSNSLSEDTELAEILDETLKLAISKATAAMENEAESMVLILTQAMDAIETALEGVKEQCKPFKEELYTKMLKRIEELIGSYKLENLEQRLVQELAIYVDKYDIGEELSRLQTHIATFRETLSVKGDIGKTLNFIIQEMQREANTLGSKFSTSNSFKLILTIKEEIEKCREIVQNVA